MSVIKDERRIDGVAEHRLGRAKARDLAAVTGRKTTRAIRAGVSDITDRASRDPYAALRRKMNRTDHPTPADLGLDIRPTAGILFARQEEAYGEAKAAGLVIPDTADYHSGQGKLARFEVLAARPCRLVEVDEQIAETSKGVKVYFACSGACQLPAGSVVLAATYAGSTMAHVMGERAVALRCQLVVAVDESDKSS